MTSNNSEAWTVYRQGNLFVTNERLVPGRLVLVRHVAVRKNRDGHAVAVPKQQLIHFGCHGLGR